MCCEERGLQLVEESLRAARRAAAVERSCGARLLPMGGEKLRAMVDMELQALTAVCNKENPPPPSSVCCFFLLCYPGEQLEGGREIRKEVKR